MNQGKVPVALLLSASILPFLGLAIGSHEFLGFDDKVNIVDNPNIKGLTWENIVWMFTGQRLGVYEPVSWLIKGGIFELFGLSPRAFHLTTLAFHLGNVVLLYLCTNTILSLLFKDLPVSRIKIVSALTALAFGVHPLRAEVVAWASGQSYAVGGFFCLLSIISYFQFQKNSAQNPSVYSWLVLSAIFYVCAIFGKSAMVLLPVWFLLIDWYVFERRDVRHVLLEKLPFFLIIAATVVIVALVNEDAMGESHLVLSWPEKFGRAVIAVFIYPIHTIWPPNLTPVYTIPKWGIEIWDTVPILAFLVLTTIVFYAAKSYRQTHWPLVVFFAYGVFLLPVLGFVQHGNPILAADRYSYVSIIPIYIGIAGCYLKLDLTTKTRQHLKSGFTVWILLLSWMTVEQVEYWQNDRVLWERALSIQPYNAFAGNNLGFHYYQKKEYAKARKYLEAAYLSDPRNEFPLLNLGVTYYELDRCDLAIEHYQQAAKEHHAQSAGLFNNMGNCFIKLGKYEQSIPHFQRALELDPDHPKAGKSLQKVFKHLDSER